MALGQRRMKMKGSCLKITNSPRWGEQTIKSIPGPPESRHSAMDPQSQDLLSSEP